MRGSNHPSSNQAFPLLISYQFCGFWKLSFNIFTQVFLQVTWEKQNTSSTTGWKLWKLCLKSQDVQLKRGKKLDQKSTPILHSFKPRVSKGQSVTPHPTPALPFLWPFLWFHSHIFLICFTFSCCIVDTHKNKVVTYPALKRVMDHVTGLSTAHIPADKHSLIFSQLTLYVLPLPQVLYSALLSWIQTGLLSFCSVCEAFRTIWLKLTGTTRLHPKRNYYC